MRDLRQSNVRLIRIQAESPLLLGDQSGTSNFQETTDYIPGSALRGALANPLLQQCTQPEHMGDHAGCPDREECPFWQLFGRQDLLVGNAYPGSFGPVWPLPLTARTCKRYAGWPIDSADARRKHGVFDVLFAALVYELVADPRFPARAQLQSALGDGWSSAWLPDLRLRQERCAHQLGGKRCGLPTKQASGYYAWAQGAPQPAQSAPVGRATHVGINRARGVAEDELLFTQETMQTAETRLGFFATLRGPREPERMEVLDKALAHYPHYVGRGRSRGNGRVLIESERNLTYPRLAERLQQFQAGIGAALAPYVARDKNIEHMLPGRLFSLTLRAPAILSEAGVPLRAPTPQIMGLPPSVIALRAWARTEEVGGWDNAAHLPRRTRLAAKAGSVFVFFAPNGIEDDTLLPALEQLEDEGIGEDCERGYGEVTVCAPFHVAKSALTEGGS